MHMHCVCMHTLHVHVHVRCMRMRMSHVHGHVHGHVHVHGHGHGHAYAHAHAHVHCNALRRGDVLPTNCPQTAYKLLTNCPQTAQLYKLPMHCMEEALHLHTLAGEARPDLDALFADAPRLHMLAVRPCLCWERRGISATENSPLITEDPRRKSK